MVSSRRLLGRIHPKGRLSAQERAARLVARKIRFGRHIQLHQVGTVPQTPFEKGEYVKRLRAIVQKRRTLKKTSSQYEKLTTKVRVLQLSRQIGMLKGGRRPNIHQLFATILLMNGLSSAKNAEIARALINIWNRDKQNIIWEGAPHNVYYIATHFDSQGRTFFELLERVLHHAKNRAVDSRTLADKIGLKWTRKNQQMINVALQTIETAGLIRKMPFMMKRTGGGISVWVHTTYRNPAILYQNPEMEILNVLNTRGPQRVSDLHHPQQQRKYWVGNEYATFSGKTVYMNLIKLEADEVIQRRKIPGRQIKGKMSVEVSLTPEGKKLMEEYHKTGHLPEKLRKILLGEKETPISSEVKEKYKEIVQLIDALLRQKTKELQP
ncbi:MAG: hypothetical protein HY393_02760 [Candidatus Diapherotrites archaeon]|nr:hypothetical protein [Candidatus Diapherotrites archaeon]